MAGAAPRNARSTWASVLAALVTCVGAVALGGCGGSGPYVTTRDESAVTQSALVLPATPLHADAPLTARGAVSVEGGVALAHVEAPGADRRAGASGHLTPGYVIQGRVAWRALPSLEVAVAGEGADGRWASTSARDLDASTYAYTESYRLGPQVRVVFNPDSALRAGVSTSLLLGRVPWSRAVTTTHTVIWVPGGGAPTTPPEVTSTYASNASLRTWVNLAFFVTGDLHRNVSLLGGVSLQGVPATRGAMSFERTCSDECRGDAPGDRPAAATEGVGTAFLSGELRLGPASLVGRAYVVVFGPSAVVDASRVGGSVGLRWTVAP